MTSHPPSRRLIRLEVSSPEATEDVARRLSALLAPGDLVALCGPLGAGKSHFARAAIRALLDDPDLEVPSPSYTLVNVYNKQDIEIWHADLYRLTDSDEMAELGMLDALPHSIVFVEWAERFMDLPKRHVRIDFDPLDDSRRRLTIEGIGGGWEALFSTLEASS